ncbi:MAG: hypothetical protein ISN26_08175, partial [Betaproteobacteria bacterium AqS2]|nr:hypothetical protein [Betaproteobacteria bacterium AqS2]
PDRDYGGAAGVPAPGVGGLPALRALHGNEHGGHGEADGGQLADQQLWWRDVDLARLGARPRIPSNILAEVDRKIDDGIPKSGDMRFNNYDPTGADAPPVGDCTRQLAGGGTNGALTGTANFWRPANAQPPVFQNCGASVFI